MYRASIICTLLAVAPVSGQVVSYEACLEFPDDDGWIRSKQPDFLLADRLLDGGWFVQLPVPLPCPPKCATDDFYRWNLITQGGQGIEDWFLEWIVITDGPEAFGDVAPASIVAGGLSGILYHFTIARDEVRMLRDTQLPQVFADIEPDVAHHYYLELHGTESYSIWIDGALIDTGIPEGEYPMTDSFTVFGARASGVPNETRWDYVRFGRIPLAASGDYDSDGTVGDDDYYFFDECFTVSGEKVPARKGCEWADMDSDLDVDCADATLFAAAWNGAGDPIMPAPCGGDPPAMSACSVDPIPAVSNWGAAVLTLLTLTAATLAFRRSLGY